MLDLLAATFAFTVIVALAMAVLFAVIVVPFVLALQLTETRGFSTGRWGLLTLLGIGLALVLAAAIYRSDLPSLAALLPLSLAYVGPTVLWLTTPEQIRIGGRPGRHE